ncbi:MAG: UMP kinase [Brevinematales bacterium]|nr:UMP kinase [Brevinematales bacterium]
MLKFKRIILKISGEVLGGDKGFGIDMDVVSFITNEVVKAYELGTEIGIVVGGGNFIRGSKIAPKGIERVNSDRLGMISTILNSITLSDSFTSKGVNSVVLSAIPIESIAEKYSVEKALEYLSKKYITLLAGGTGNPFFSTDTSAVLRAAELQADVVLKATKVDGIYDKDPMKYKDAKRFEEITGNEVLAMNLKVMDLTAFSLSCESQIPIVVFNLMEKDGIKRIVLGEKVGTFVKV